MKKLNRLLLINWHYFTKKMIDFGTINFITGKNAAGKSTIIDALQVVLMGETRASSFNSAANIEKKSERSLKSYLIGSLGENVEGGDKSMRGGEIFTTYIVAEIYDDVKDEYFCFGAVFDVNCGDIKKKYFRLADRIPEDCFIKDKKSMDIKRLSQYFKENYSQNKYEVTGTAETYREWIRGRFNVNDPKMFAMLKKAISFKPINDIEKFITEYVCDIEDDIDISSMQENITYYMRQESIAEEFENKLKALEVIRSSYGEVERLKTVQKRQEFLIDCAELDERKLELDRKKQEAKSYAEQIEEAAKCYKEIEKEIRELNDEKKRLEAKRNKYWLTSNGDYLKEEIERCENFIKKTSGNIKKTVLDIRQNCEKWKAIIGRLAIQDDDEAAELAQRLYQQLELLEKISKEKLSEYSADFFSLINQSFTVLKKKLSPVISDKTVYKNKLEDEIKKLKSNIEKLKEGIMPYPQKALKLKNALKAELEKQSGHSVRVDFFADLIDVSDEEWHNAIEGFLNTQRMYLIIEPEYFADAYRIFKSVRHRIGVYEYRIVDCERVLSSHRNCVENNLAEVISSENIYARAYADYLMGGVTRCYDDANIRSYKRSVTRECMIYSGFSVGTLNREVYESPYIGRSSIEKQLENNRRRLEVMEDELSLTNDTVKRLLPINGEWFMPQSYIDSTIADMYSAAEELVRYRAKLSEANKEYSEINLDWLDDIDRKIKKCGESSMDKSKSLGEISGQKRSSEQSRRKLIEETIPKLEDNIRDCEELFNSKYDSEYISEIKAGFYDAELRKRETPRAIIDGFKSPLEGTKTLLSKKVAELLTLRGEYNRTQNVSFDFQNTDSNGDYEKEYLKIKDTELPAYREKIAEAKESAMEQFKSDFLFRLKNNINETYMRIEELNKALRFAKFGGDSYHFKVEANPPYQEYYNMIMSESLMKGGPTLFSYDFTSKYQSTLDSLFSQIVRLSDDESSTGESVEMFSKYKTYLHFDLIIKDSRGNEQSAARTIAKKSGGETQTPFYVSVLASFAQLYRVNDTKEIGNTFRLVIFDEAFSKMDSERIIESVKLLRQFRLQAIVCTPPDKISDIAPLADKTYLVYKDIVPNGYKSNVIEWTKEMSDDSDEPQDEDTQSAD